MKKICILGSTGSIGTQAIEVIREHGFKITGLSGSQQREASFRASAGVYARKGLHF